MCGGHRMMDKHYIMYDDVVRVPLIIKWPGVIDLGLKTDKFVSNCFDLPPTILEAIEMETKDFFHGQSLLPLIGNPDELRNVIHQEENKDIISNLGKRLYDILERDGYTLIRLWMKEQLLSNKKL